MASFEIHGVGERFGFRYKNNLGKVVVRSRLYKSKSALFNGIKSFKNNAQIESMFKREAINGLYYFHIIANNHVVLAVSPYFKSESSRNDEIAKMMIEVSNTEIVDLC